MRRAITYGYDEETEETFATVGGIRLTDAEIDRIVAARNEYHREKTHRGYPIKG